MKNNKNTCIHYCNGLCYKKRDTPECILYLEDTCIDYISNKIDIKNTYRNLNKQNILDVIDLIKDECPNNDIGGLCEEFTNCGGCLICWQEYLIKNSTE